MDDWHVFMEPSCDALFMCFITTFKSSRWRWLAIIKLLFLVWSGCNCMGVIEMRCCYSTHIMHTGFKWGELFSAWLVRVAEFHWFIVILRVACFQVCLWGLQLCGLHVSARLLVRFRCPINTCLRIVIFEAPGNAILSVVWPLPSNSGLASFHAVHGEHYRLV